MKTEEIIVKKITLEVGDVIELHGGSIPNVLKREGIKKAHAVVIKESRNNSVQVLADDYSKYIINEDNYKDISFIEHIDLNRLFGGKIKAEDE